MNRALRRFGVRVPVLMSVMVALSLLLSGCGDAPSSLNPAGPAAGRIAGLWWWLLFWATVVAVVTFALLGFALWRARQDRPPVEYPMGLSGERFTILAGAVVPTVILVMVMFVTLDVMADLETPPDEPSVVIEIVGWMWWWEVRYPDTGAVTANEIHIPAGETVELRLTAADVIHSFWVPEIGGKIDLVPGSENTVWVKADEPGIFRGQCAEFCGIQHTFMAKLLVVQEPAEFRAWLDRESRDAPEPEGPEELRGQEVFMEQQCQFCHTIRGTEAVGDVGPDLTHVMSRQTLGAATIQNSVSAIASWTADPHQFKPGVKMPAVNFEGEDFEALIAYLASLE